MNTRQHSILTHLERIVSALLPGGTWRGSRFSADPCPAGLVIDRVTKRPAMKDRVYFRGTFKA